MMPHLGVLASVHPRAAQEIFENDCLIYLGSSVVPVYPAKRQVQGELATVFVNDEKIGSVLVGTVTRLATPRSGKGVLRVVPSHGFVDVGNGPGKLYEREVNLGECGIVCDGRNRPIVLPEPRAVAQEVVFSNLGLLGEGSNV
jgi:hypothetical protein